MLYYNFKNYQEFQELFGIVEHGNGVKSRKNKILLSLFKSKELLHKKATLKPAPYRRETSWAINRKTGTEVRYTRWCPHFADTEGLLLNVRSLTELRSTLYGMMMHNGTYRLELK
jgi:hypothetical protein